MKYQGNPVSKGIAIGPVYLYQPFEPVVEEGHVEEGKAAEAVARYHEVKAAAGEELNKIQQSLMEEHPDKAEIFMAHYDILSDVAMEEEIIDLIENSSYTPDWALHTIYEQYIAILSEVEDELIRERVADLKDVRNRFLRCYAGVAENNLSALDKPVVVVANDLLPSDTATLDRQKVLAIVTEIGGSTSHSAIIARSYEIPALLGVNDITKKLETDQTVIVDAVEGVMFQTPEEALIKEYEDKREVFKAEWEATKKFIDKEPLLKDGEKIQVMLNVASADEEELKSSKYTDGVGLFRTEFLYMGGDKLPTEEEQYEEYKRVLEEFGDRPVTLRTLDIGGDKNLSYMELPKEENPFLGKRALRLCFDELDIFKTQLRAAYRASVHGNLWIMLPMVGSIDDIRKAKAIIEEVKQQLNQDQIAYSKDVKVGIMIEIPSIALMADLVAKEVDFASIGTNDLCQYLTAVDRLNPEVTKYYQSYHPAMFRIMGYAIEQFNLNDKPIGVCGEMGGDPLAAKVLVGLGMKKLSMGAASIAPVKKMITETTMEEARKTAEAVKALATAEEVEQFLK